MVCIFCSHLHLFLPELEISDRIQQKMAFVFMIIQVKTIDTTSDVTLGDIRNNTLAYQGLIKEFLYQYGTERFKGKSGELF